MDDDTDTRTPLVSEGNGLWTLTVGEQKITGITTTEAISIARDILKVRGEQ